jgi:hypothetical protein
MRLLLSLFLCFTIYGCGNFKQTDEQEKRISALLEKWEDLAEKSKIHSELYQYLLDEGKRQADESAELLRKQKLQLEESLKLAEKQKLLVDDSVEMQKEQKWQMEQYRNQINQRY